MNKLIFYFLSINSTHTDINLILLESKCFNKIKVSNGDLNTTINFEISSNENSNHRDFNGENSRKRVIDDENMILNSIDIKKQKLLKNDNFYQNKLNIGKDINLEERNENLNFLEKSSDSEKYLYVNDELESDIYLASNEKINLNNVKDNTHPNNIINNITSLYDKEVTDFNINVINKKDKNNQYRFANKFIDKNILEFLNNFDESNISYEFINIFELIENDLKNSLKNSIKYIYEKNSILTSILYNLNQHRSLKAKIYELLIFANEILNINNLNVYELNSKKSLKIYTLLSSIYQKKRLLTNINNKLRNKFNQMIIKIDKNYFNENEIVSFTINLINDLTDKNMKLFCIYGLQNFFVDEYDNYLHRFIHILTLLFTFINEKEYFILDWHEKLFRLLTISKNKYKNPKYFNKICQKIIKFGIYNVFYRLYISLNAKMSNISLDCYEKLQKDIKQIYVINYLIDIINKTKCKLFNILQE